MNREAPLEPLTTPERRRILQGDYSALKRESKPSWGVSERLTVLLGKEQRHADPETGEVIKVPARELVWIEVSHPPFLSDGRWVVRFNVYDRREENRYLGPGGGYTSSPHLSTDKDQGHALQAVDDETLNRYAIENGVQYALENASKMEADQARRWLNIIASLQREAAQLGLNVAPDLEAVAGAMRERIVEHRKAA